MTWDESALHKSQCSVEIVGLKGSGEKYNGCKGTIVTKRNDGHINIEIEGVDGMIFDATENINVKSENINVLMELHQGRLLYRKYGRDGPDYENNPDGARMHGVCDDCKFDKRFRAAGYRLVNPDYDSDLEEVY